MMKFGRPRRPVARLLVALLAFSQALLADDWTDHLRYESDNGSLSLRISGRLHADVASINYAGSEDDVAEEWRRARLAISGRLLDDWRFRYEYDFAAPPDSEIKDAWIGYFGLGHTSLRAGNLQEPVSIEELSSSNATTFMERGLPNALVPGYHLGLLANTWGDRWSGAVGVFDGEIQGRDGDIDDGWGVSTRGVVYHEFIGGGLLHGGASLAYRVPPGDDGVRFSSRPEVHLSERSLVSTGRLSDVDYTLTTGMELVALWGPGSVQAEYLRTDVERDGRPDVSFDGGYILGSWFLHGGKRNYDRRDGTFDAVKPTGRFGAWEFAVRYSVLDLEDDPITGGTERNWTVGLNWYATARLRLMFNQVWARANPNRDGVAENLSATQVRLQYVF
jgi:phosphate-selective porin OprO/OprP